VGADRYEVGAESFVWSWLSQVTADIGQALAVDAMVKVGIEVAGHFHRPLLTAGSWPIGWEVLEFNPGHVTEQQQGRPYVPSHRGSCRGTAPLSVSGRRW
jgi:hypothetical protein